MAAAPTHSLIIILTVPLSPAPLQVAGTTATLAAALGAVLAAVLGAALGAAVAAVVGATLAAADGLEPLVLQAARARLRTAIPAASRVIPARFSITCASLSMRRSSAASCDVELPIGPGPWRASQPPLENSFGGRPPAP